MTSIDDDSFSTVKKRLPDFPLFHTISSWETVELGTICMSLCSASQCIYIERFNSAAAFLLYRWWDEWAFFKQCLT